MMATPLQSVVATLAAKLPPGVPKGSIPIGPIPGRPELQAFIVPQMSPGEGGQFGNIILLGPGFTRGRMFHEATHASQEKKLGPLYGVLYRLIEKMGVPYDFNPFEVAAMKTERRFPGGTPPIIGSKILYTHGR